MNILAVIDTCTQSYIYILIYIVVGIFNENTVVGALNLYITSWIYNTMYILSGDKIWCNILRELKNKRANRIYKRALYM